MPKGSAHNRRMPNLWTLWDRLDDALRECAGMLRRRSATATTVRILLIACVLLLGAYGFASGNATALFVGIVLLLGIGSAIGRLR